MIWPSQGPLLSRHDTFAKKQHFFDVLNIILEHAQTLLLFGKTKNIIFLKLYFFTFLGKFDIFLTVD